MISQKELDNLLNNISKIIGVQYTPENLENNTCNADVLIEENTIMCIFLKHINEVINEKKQSLLLSMIEYYKNEKVNDDNKPKMSPGLRNQLEKNSYQIYESQISVYKLKEQLIDLQKANDTPITSDSPLLNNNIKTIDYESKLIDQAVNQYNKYWKITQHNTDEVKKGSIVIPEDLYSATEVEPFEEFVPSVEQMINKPTKTRRNAKTS
jgi:hypothetical protein